MWHFLDVAGPWLMVIAVIAVPLLLAWWLTDGFAGWRAVESAPPTYQSAYNPHNGHWRVIPVDRNTGAPLSYPE
jgi:hypothetical protein